METIIKADNLVKKFKLSSKQRKANKTKDKEKIALNHLSLEVYKGEIFGLLGPNGAGKTTTLRIMSTLIKADEGTVTIDGKDVKNDVDYIKNNVAFLTTDVKLDDYFTPEYLFDFFGSLHGMTKEQVEARKKILFDKFEINDYKNLKIKTLSTGMKQKVSIAVSLVHDPKIIIFDEPTNGLDIITAKIVTDYLIELKNEGKTVIVSTHIFSLVERICDRVCIVINGKTVACDTLKELTKEKNLEDVFFDLYLANTEGVQNA